MVLHRRHRLPGQGRLLLHHGPIKGNDRPFHGQKIFPDELEKVYKQIPHIKEICLVQTERGLEAAVVPDFDYLPRDEHLQLPGGHCGQNKSLAKDLSPYKRIMGLKVFKDPLPVTRLGKLRRAMVKDLYLQGGGPAEKPVQEPDRALLSGDAGMKVLSCIQPFSPKKDRARRQPGARPGPGLARRWSWWWASSIPSASVCRTPSAPRC